MLSESFMCLFANSKRAATCLFVRSGFCLATLPYILHLRSAAETAVLMAGSPISAKELCSSIRVVIGYLVTSLTKDLLSQVLSLVRWPALGRVWVVHLACVQLVYPMCPSLPPLDLTHILTSTPPLVFPHFHFVTFHRALAFPRASIMYIVQYNKKKRLHC